MANRVIRDDQSGLREDQCRVPGQTRHNGGHQTRECATIRVLLSRGTSMELTAVLTPAEEGGYVALNPETGTTTQGETVEEAVANLKEATALYLLEFPLPTPGHPVITMFSLPADA